MIRFAIALVTARRPRARFKSSRQLQREKRNKSARPKFRGYRDFSRGPPLPCFEEREHWRTEGGWFRGRKKKKRARRLLPINNRYYAPHYGIEKKSEKAAAANFGGSGRRVALHAEEFTKKI